MTEDILTEAKRLTEQDRNKSYGPIIENMKKTVIIFKEMTGVDMSPLEAIKFMIAHKIARESCKHKRDNLVDACGYIRLLDEEYKRK